jgi:hypothetical protein
MTDALYLLTITLPDDYDGEAIDAPALMAATLGLIARGEDEVPVFGISCERIDSPPVRPEHTDSAMLERAGELLDDAPDGGDPYDDGYRDALNALIGDD